MPIDVAAKCEAVLKNSTDTLSLRTVLRIDQVKDLTEAFRDNTSLVEVNLGTAMLADEGAKQLFGLWDKDKQDKIKAKAKEAEGEKSEKELQREKEAAKNAKEENPLQQLMTLELYRNQIGVAGVDAMAKAFTSGALPQLKNLFLSNNETREYRFSRRRSQPARCRSSTCWICTATRSAMPACMRSPWPFRRVRCRSCASCTSTSKAGRTATL